MRGGVAEEDFCENGVVSIPAVLALLARRPKEFIVVGRQGLSSDAYTAAKKGESCQHLLAKLRAAIDAPVERSPVSRGNSSRAPTLTCGGAVLEPRKTDTCFRDKGEASSEDPWELQGDPWAKSRGKGERTLERPQGKPRAKWRRISDGAVDFSQGDPWANWRREEKSATAANDEALVPEEVPASSGWTQVGDDNAVASLGTLVAEETYWQHCCETAALEAELSAAIKVQYFWRKLRRWRRKRCSEEVVEEEPRHMEHDPEPHNAEQEKEVLAENAPVVGPEDLLKNALQEKQAEEAGLAAVAVLRKIKERKLKHQEKRRATKRRQKVHLAKKGGRRGFREPAPRGSSPPSQTRGGGEQPYP